MKIEIKPGDQGLVGKRLIWIPSQSRRSYRPDQWVEVLFVGQQALFGIDDMGVENAFLISGHWELIEDKAVSIKISDETKQKRLLAPALYQEIDREGYEWFLSHMLYTSLEQAKRDLDNHFNITWPAIPNAQGYYEVEE